MSRNLKIDKINAYKRMLETLKLPKVPDDKASQAQDPNDPTTWPVEQQVQSEFTQWVESQLAELLGEGRPVKPSSADVFDVFSSDQIEVLQQFADRMIDKANQPAPPQTAPTKAPQQKGTGNTGGYIPPKDARPLGNRRMQQDASRLDKDTSKKLSRLEQMENDYDPET